MRLRPNLHILEQELGQSIEVLLWVVDEVHYEASIWDLLFDDQLEVVIGDNLVLLKVAHHLNQVRDTDDAWLLLSLIDFEAYNLL